MSPWPWRFLGSAPKIVPCPSQRVSANSSPSPSPRNSAVSWPAMRLLGLLAEKHFAEPVAALENHGECQELEGLEAELERISSEVAPS